MQLEINERERTEHDIIINIAKAKTKMENFNKNEQRRESIANETQCLLDHHEHDFKLPQIQIEKFDGSFSLAAVSRYF